MKTKLVLFIILLFVIGCTSTEKKGAQPDDGAIVIDVNSALKSEGRNFEDMIESVELIPLETTEASVVGGVGNCIVAEKYIYLEDSSDGANGVIQFDRNGKFVKRYQRGGATDEFNFIETTFYANNYLYIVANDKILKFTDSGKFVDAKSNSGRYHYMMNDGDGFVTFQLENENQEHKIKIIKLDSNLVKISELNLDPIIPLVPNSELVCFDGNKCLIDRFADNNIYCWSDSNFIVKYRIDLADNEYQISTGQYQDMSWRENFEKFHTMYDNVDEGKYLFFGSVQESEDYLSFCIMTHQDYKNIFYNKITGKAWVKNRTKVESPWKNMWGPWGTIRIPKPNNTYFGLIMPESIKDCWKNNPNNLFSAKDIEILKNAKEDDNPIIVIYKLKDNL